MMSDNNFFQHQDPGAYRSLGCCIYVVGLVAQVTMFYGLTSGPFLHPEFLIFLDCLKVLIFSCVETERCFLYWHHYAQTWLKALGSNLPLIFERLCLLPSDYFLLF
uniref:Uncharacterized protein n=1 Tax=Opuntia streptacantha TaxID=393608 RepID=A0A7C9FMU2_OPUST